MGRCGLLLSRGREAHVRVPAAVSIERVQPGRPGVCMVRPRFHDLPRGARVRDRGPTARRCRQYAKARRAAHTRRLIGRAGLVLGRASVRENGRSGGAPKRGAMPERGGVSGLWLPRSEGGHFVAVTMRCMLLLLRSGELAFGLYVLGSGSQVGLRVNGSSPLTGNRHAGGREVAR